MNRGVLFFAPGLFLAGVLPCVTGAESGAGPPLPLTAVTFNLFHGGPLSGLTGNGQNLDRRLDMVVEELRGLRADVIGLQEASTSRRRGGTAARLAAALGLQHVYAAASSRFFGNSWMDRVVAGLLNFSEGPAILSRFPLLDWEVHDLPRCGRLLDSRVLLGATLQTPWGPLRAFSTHTRGEPCQTRRVAELLRERRGRLPAVLMGDFNAAPDSAAITALTGEAGFLDAYGAAKPTQPGPTVWQRIDDPVSTVRRRVDYIFVVPGTEFAGGVLASRLVLNAPRRLPDGGALWPSDHYGVLAEVKLLARDPSRAQSP